MRALLLAHIVLGGAGLIAYWIPVFAKKGGPLHVRVGRWFVWCGYGVVATAVAICVLRLWGDPTEREKTIAAFLGYLALATLGFLRQAVLVVRTRRAPETLTKDRVHQALGVACLLASAGMVAGGFFGAPPARVLLLAMSPIGVIAGVSILRFRRAPQKTRMAWWYEHVSAIGGAGIAFHTAFLVFGGSSFFRLPGALQVVPWIAPTIVGTPAIVLTVRHYRHKFGEL
ncbi:MAG: hypothetical protein AAGD14_01265 [Planctomycetota bacterium]